MVERLRPEEEAYMRTSRTIPAEVWALVDGLRDDRDKAMEIANSMRATAEKAVNVANECVSALREFRDGASVVAPSTFYNTIRKASDVLQRTTPYEFEMTTEKK